MRDPIKREVIFHGAFAEKYVERLEVGADSMFALCSIVFKGVFPDLLKEQSLMVVVEDESGVKTELFDPEQVLLPTQKVIHIMPNPDGAIEAATIYAIITMIVSLGIAVLMAPKMENTATTSSGNNFDSVENVIGQGGVMPILLGTRKIGSRVVSHGIDSVVLIGRSSVYA